MSTLLGVLGGMGPLATVDFLGKLIAETPARCDAEHIPVVVYSVPQIPDRPRAILENGKSPLPAMLEGIRTLKQAGATCVAIPCNTAHYWYDELVREGGLPIPHIADAACSRLVTSGISAATVGLIATKGTIAAGFFQERLAARGYRCLTNTAQDLDTLVLPAIECVKRNDLDEAHRLATNAAQRLQREGAQAIILACTEIPLAIERQPAAIAAPCIDATRALAQACVAWWRSTAR
ncbi:MAG: aspartate/glutamate racemase family protein [Burkholderiales bacterium]